jgi:hypothetical protein
MRKAEVEIYDDTTNYAVLRHPDRKFPGALVQGDTLFSLCTDADELCEALRLGKSGEAAEIANNLRNALWDRLNHYQQVLDRHGLPVPFSRTLGI